MPVNHQHGDRKKTAGGVFIHLLKSHPCIPDDTKSVIFKEEKIGRKTDKKLAKDLDKALSLF